MRCAPLHGAVVRKAFWTAVIVGTVLTIINQGDALLIVVLTGQAAPELLWKIPLTYCVPYAVSSYSALAISRV